MLKIKSDYRKINVHSTVTQPEILEAIYDLTKAGLVIKE